MTNPLLADWNTPFEIAPFDEITDDDFAPAFDIALERPRAEIDAIADNADAPSFRQHDRGAGGCRQALDKVLAVFFTVAGADSNPAREKLQRDFSPKLAAHFFRDSGNKALFTPDRHPMGRPRKP